MSDMSSDRRRATRVNYNIGFWIAKFDGENIPPASQFQEVQGCDLSPIGISYFSDKLSSSDDVVLMFKGKDGAAYMACRIIHHRQGFVGGRRQYVIGCEFMRRLLPNVTPRE